MQIIRFASLDMLPKEAKVTEHVLLKAKPFNFVHRGGIVQLSTFSFPGPLWWYKGSALHARKFDELPVGLAPPHRINTSPNELSSSALSDPVRKQIIMLLIAALLYS